jgi:hypothetical protein
MATSINKALEPGHNPTNSPNPATHPPRPPLAPHRTFLLPLLLNSPCSTPFLRSAAYSSAASWGSWATAYCQCFTYPVVAASYHITQANGPLKTFLSPSPDHRHHHHNPCCLPMK